MCVSCCRFDSFCFQCLQPWARYFVQLIWLDVEIRPKNEGQATVSRDVTQIMQRARIDVASVMHRLLKVRCEQQQCQGRPLSRNGLSATSLGKHNPSHRSTFRENSCTRACVGRAPRGTSGGLPRHVARLW